MIFFALAQRQQEIEKRREERRQEAIRELLDRNIKVPPEIMRKENGRS